MAAGSARTVALHVGDAGLCFVAGTLNSPLSATHANLATVLSVSQVGER